MAALRSLCLPRLTFLLLSVLQNSSRHQEALRLADIISSDQHRLYQVSAASASTSSLLSPFFFFIRGSRTDKLLMTANHVINLWLVHRCAVYNLCHLTPIQSWQSFVPHWLDVAYERRVLFKWLEPDFEGFSAVFPWPVLTEPCQRFRFSPKKSCRGSFRSCVTLPSACWTVVSTRWATSCNLEHNECPHKHVIVKICLCPVSLFDCYIWCSLLQNKSFLFWRRVNFVFSCLNKFLNLLINKL